MTKQEYYDLLVCSALDGTFPSVASWGDVQLCAYRGVAKDGTRTSCAVGILIADENYSKDMEEKGVMNEMVCHKLHIPVGMDINDVKSCQDLHDGCATAHNISGQEFVSDFLTRLNCHLILFGDVVKVEGCTMRRMAKNEVSDRRGAG